MSSSSQMSASGRQLPRYEATQDTMESAFSELAEAYQTCPPERAGCRDPLSPGANVVDSTLKLSDARRGRAQVMVGDLLKAYAYAKGSVANNSLDQFNDCNNYLYLDPKIIAEVDLHGYMIKEHDKFVEDYLEKARKCSLETFMRAATYVGKGTGDRCYEHLGDAADFLHRYIPGVHVSKKAEELQWKKNGDYIAKILHIVKLWMTGTGPVVFVFNKDMYRPVAETREAAIIEALPHLTNFKTGTAHTPLRGRSVDLAAYGLLLLEEAHKRFVREPPLPFTRL